MSDHTDEYRNIMEDLDESVSVNTGETVITQRFFYRKKSHQVHGWIDVCVNVLLPFKIVTNEVYQRNVRFEPISLNTLQKDVEKLTSLAEQKILKLLPSKYALIFDGWTSTTTHYLAIYASFPSTSNKSGYE